MACTCYGNPPISQPKTCVRGCLYRGKPAQVTNLAIARFRWMNVCLHLDGQDCQNKSPRLSCIIEAHFPIK